MRQIMTKDSSFNLNQEDWDNIEEYKEDFKSVIQQREENRVLFAHNSPQFMLRSPVVEHLKKISAELELSLCSLHLSVYLLDIFMDNHSIITPKVLLVANVCLLIAAKFEENKEHCPKISDLNETLTNQFERDDYKKIESIILNFFDWYVMFPTAAHYTHYYIRKAISSRDDPSENHTVRSLLFELQHQIEHLLDLVIDDVHFMQHYKPSHIAAAIIAAGRREIGLNSWNEPLEKLTDYKLSQIIEVVDLLLSRCTLECDKCESMKN